MIGFPSYNEKVLQNDTFFSNVWFRFFEAMYKAIRGNLNIKIGGVLSFNTTSKSNVSSSQTNLISYELKANSLATSGDILEIDCWGIFAANANNKTITLEFGSQTILDTGSVAANSGAWRIKAKIIRTASNTQEIISEIISGNSSVSDSVTRTAGTQTLSNNLTIKITATGAASDDVTQYAMLINLYPNS